MDDTSESQGFGEASVLGAEAATAKALIAKCETELASYSGYFEFHRERYEYLWRLCKRLVPQQRATVIEVGRSPSSARLVSHDAEVYTLDLPPRDKEFGTLTTEAPMPHVGHIVFDLNEAQRSELWPRLPQADLRVLCGDD